MLYNLFAEKISIFNLMKIEDFAVDFFNHLIDLVTKIVIFYNLFKSF